MKRYMCDARECPFSTMAFAAGIALAMAHLRSVMEGMDFFYLGLACTPLLQFPNACKELKGRSNVSDV